MKEYIDVYIHMYSLQYKTLLKYNVICVPFLQAILLQESEIITPYVDVADNPYYHT